jgi:hypothetical protein
MKFGDVVGTHSSFVVRLFVLFVCLFLRFVLSFFLSFFLVFNRYIFGSMKNFLSTESELTDLTLLQKNNSQLFIRSYELGVLFCPQDFGVRSKL